MQHTLRNGDLGEHSSGPCMEHMRMEHARTEHIRMAGALMENMHTEHMRTERMLPERCVTPLRAKVDEGKQQRARSVATG